MRRKTGVLTEKEGRKKRREGCRIKRGMMEEERKEGGRVIKEERCDGESTMGEWVGR